MQGGVSDTDAWAYRAGHGGTGVLALTKDGEAHTCNQHEKKPSLLCKSAMQKKNSAFTAPQKDVSGCSAEKYMFLVTRPACLAPPRMRQNGVQHVHERERLFFMFSYTETYPETYVPREIASTPPRANSVRHS